MELFRFRLVDQEVFLSHAKAALIPIQHLRIGKLIVQHGWSVAHAAVFLHVSWPTAKRWANRCAAMGDSGMGARSSRPQAYPHAPK